MDILETDEQALDAFKRGQAFLVAAYLVEPHLKRVQAHVRRPLTERRVMVGEFPAKAYLFSKVTLNGSTMRDVLFGTDSKKGVLEQGVKDIEVMAAKTKGCTMPFVCSDESKTEMFDKKDKNIGEDEELKRSNAAMAVHRLVQLFSRVTGMRVKFHSDSLGEYRAPMPEEPDTIHLHVGCSPPGEHGDLEWRTVLFGCQLNPNLHYVQFRSGTKGRGMLLKHTDGLTETAYVQLMGSNIYLLFPVISVYWEPNTPIVFCKALGKAYEALLDGVTEAETGPEALKTPDDKTFVAAVSEAVTYTADFWKKRMDEEQEKIEAQRKVLHNLYTSMKEWEVRLEACSKKSFYTDTLDRMVQDKATIQAMPEVERIAVIESGVHVYTKPLTMEWEGKKYPLGRFAVRIGKWGNIGVWGVESTHPDGVPHPHISKSGRPCFGNATDAITKASAEFRVADVVKHLISWLMRGYTPELAANKIEEWPVVRTQKRSKHGTERIASKKDIRSGRSATRDRHRSGVGRESARAHARKRRGD